MNLVVANVPQVDRALLGQKQRGVKPVVPGSNARKGSLLDFVGATKGLYGDDTDQVARHLRDERSSWER